MFTLRHFLTHSIAFLLIIDQRIRIDTHYLLNILPLVPDIPDTLYTRRSQPHQLLHQNKTLLLGAENISFLQNINWAFKSEQYSNEGIDCVKNSYKSVLQNTYSP